VNYSVVDRQTSRDFDASQLNQTQREQDSESAFQDVFYEGFTLKNGKIDVKEWREKLVQKGYQKGNYLLRKNQSSPRPQMKHSQKQAVERLYKDGSSKQEHMKHLKNARDQEVSKNCTFAPNLKKERSVGLGSPKPKLSGGRGQLTERNMKRSPVN